jgi:hypothetical protein
LVSDTAESRFDNNTDRVVFVNLLNWETGAYDIDYQNGMAIIESPEASNATFIIATYDDYDKLIGITSMDIALGVGRNEVAIANEHSGAKTKNHAMG